MPSGSITVTPGTTVTASTEIDEDVLNDLALPTMAVAENAVGLREIARLADIVEGVGAAAVARNGFPNPHFDRDLIEATSAVTCPTTAGTQVVPQWYTRPAGATVTTQHGAFTVAGATAAACVILTGATSATTVDFYCYLPAYRSQRYADAGDVTISFTIQNNTGAALTPSLRIDTSNTPDDRTTLTNRVAENAASSIANGAVAVRSWTVDWAALTNGANGARVTLRLPSGSLDGSGKSVRIGAPLLVPGTSAGEWGLFPEGTGSTRSLRRHALHQTADPTYTNDRSEGWSVGSVWRNRTTGDRFQCVRDITDSAVWVKLSPNTEGYALFRFERPSGTNGGDSSTSSINYPPLGYAEVMDPDGQWTPSGTFIQFSSRQIVSCQMIGVVFDSGLARLRLDAPVGYYLRHNIATQAQAYTSNLETQLCRVDGLYVHNEETVNNRVLPKIITQTAKAGTGLGIAASFGTEVYGFAVFRPLQIPAFGNNNLRYDTSKAPNAEGLGLAKVVLEEPVTKTELATGTIQGVTIADGDNILLIGQEDPAENGFYNFFSGFLNLSHQGGKQNTLVQIEGGIGRGRTYLQVLPVTTIGTDPQKWIEIDAPVLLPII